MTKHNHLTSNSQQQENQKENIEILNKNSKKRHNTFQRTSSIVSLNRKKQRSKVNLFKKSTTTTSSDITTTRRLSLLPTNSSSNRRKSLFVNPFSQTTTTTAAAARRQSLGSYLKRTKSSTLDKIKMQAMLKCDQTINKLSNQKFLMNKTMTNSDDYLSISSENNSPKCDFNRSYSSSSSSMIKLNCSPTLVRSFLPSPRLLKRYRYSVMPTNDELNNKIDLEIRILDGILKLLNAITVNSNSSTVTTSTNMQSNVNSNVNTSSNDLIDSHLLQIITACKCLFVSHRKIAIYLNNLSNKNSQLMNDDTNETSRTSTKLYFSNLRIPLIWKWNDYVKASRNSENVSAKYAAFALIYVGNMIYDTNLVFNIDATMTEINFSESFVFEDVDINNFEMHIEIYSYELSMSTTNNLIIQSARKLAKQLTDFAKRTTLTINNLNAANHLQNSTFSLNNSGNSTSGSMNDAYSYSMHRFKLCAYSILNKTNLSENIETRNLNLVSDSNLDQNGLNYSCSTLNTINTNTTGGTTSTNSSNKLPLFDQYCCCLRAATSTPPPPIMSKNKIEIDKQSLNNEIL